MVWHLGQLSFQLILTIVFRTCSGDQVSASALADLFDNAYSVTQWNFSLDRRVKRSVVFFSFVFYRFFRGLWLSWWRLTSFEAILLRRPAWLCPSMRADLLYVGSSSRDNECWLLTGRNERLQWLPGFLPSLSLTSTVHHPNPEVLSLVCTVPHGSKNDEDFTAFFVIFIPFLSNIQILLTKSHCHKLLKFMCCVRSRLDFGSLNSASPASVRLWQLNEPRSCWSLFMSSVPVCRTCRWKISKILSEHLQGHTLAGVSYICSPETSAGVWLPNKTPQSTFNCVKICFIYIYIYMYIKIYIYIPFLFHSIITSLHTA